MHKIDGEGKLRHPVQTNTVIHENDTLTDKNLIINCYLIPMINLSFLEVSKPLLYGTVQWFPFFQFFHTQEQI